MAYETDKNLPPDKKLIEEARKCLKACIDEEEQERKKQLDDLRFCTLDQWPDSIRKDREDTWIYIGWAVCGMEKGALRWW